jgi:uncharacterized protein YuzB (UPF0349 family)
VVEYGCLGFCGECYANPYALLNGEVIFADTAEELYDQIIAKIKEAVALDKLLDE